ncbi:MAG: ferritin family protein [Candidatus Omnitrophica bacterium]|nr:ferritin family protein [Candidatus Omnitrophota bacterium]MCM8769988.1 ferritin family protein [Candidatus Omnitrophota bacterium]
MDRDIVQYSASEVLQFAIRIEENGESFYRKLAEKTTEPKAKQIFSFLAQQEKQHGKKFKEMLKEVENYQPEEMYPDEYFTYLRSFADNIIFTSVTDQELSEKPGRAEAIDFAIRRELDSIMYYLETKPLLPAAQRKTVDQIIEEERRHFLQLSNLRKEIS